MVLIDWFIGGRALAFYILVERELQTNRIHI